MCQKCKGQDYSLMKRQFKQKIYHILIKCTFAKESTGTSYLLTRQNFMDKTIKRISVFHFNGPEGLPEGGSQAEKGVLSRTTEFHPEWGKPVCETQYDVHGQMEQKTDYVYDNKGFLIREVLIESDGEVVEERSFEPNERQGVKKEFRHYADGSHDVADHFYDEAGRLVRKVIADDEGEVERIETLSYSGERLVHELATDGQENMLFEVRYVYDEDGLLEEVHINNPEEGTAYQKVHEYDTDGKKTATLVYDQNGELIERYLFELNEQGHPSSVVEETRTKKNALKMTYDEQGNVVYQEEHDLAGELVNRVERRYDGEGRLVESHVAFRNPMLGVIQEYSVFQEYEFF